MSSPQPPNALARPPDEPWLQTVALNNDVPARLALWDYEAVGAWAVERTADRHSEIAWLAGAIQRLLGLLADATRPSDVDDGATQAAARLLHGWASDARCTAIAIEQMLVGIGGDPDAERQPYLDGTST